MSLLKQVVIGKRISCWAPGDRSLLAVGNGLRAWLLWVQLPTLYGRTSIAILSRWDQQYLHFLSCWQRPSGTTVLLIGWGSVPRWPRLCTEPSPRTQHLAPLGSELLSLVKHAGILDRILDLWQTWKCLRSCFGVFDWKELSVLSSWDTGQVTMEWMCDQNVALTPYAACAFCHWLLIRPDLTEHVNFCWSFLGRKTVRIPHG